MAGFQRTDASAPVPTTEVFGRLCTYPGLPTPMISYGLPYDQAIVKHISASARVYVIASKTLCATSDCLDRLKTALGPRFVGARIGMTSHTLYSECLTVAAEARALSADTVVTLGAGSLADAAKFVCSTFTNTYATVADLAAHESRRDEVTGKVVHPPTTPHDRTLIMIPTSLSAGEHTPYAGVTDAETRRKYQVRTGGTAVTILDPWLCARTPSNIWLQSGCRGIDHGVEHAVGPTATPEAMEICRRGLQFLVPGLLACVRETADSDPAEVAKGRLNAQLGVAMTVTPLLWGVSAGASHGIGHMLGPMGVGHGETSCILMPAVNRYNKSANGDKQAVISRALWDATGCKELFEGKGLEEDKADLADLLDVIIRALGMPRTLKEKGIVGEQTLKSLAENSLLDFYCAINPRPLTKTEEVMEILREVEG